MLVGGCSQCHDGRAISAQFLDEFLPRVDLYDRVTSNEWISPDQQTLVEFSMAPKQDQPVLDAAELGPVADEL